MYIKMHICLPISIHNLSSLKKLFCHSSYSVSMRFLDFNIFILNSSFPYLLLNEQVLFIGAANNINKVPAPLLDRLNVLTLPGYTAKEKACIAEKYLLPSLLKESGMDEKVIFSMHIQCINIFRYINYH
jgi:hypothetical protein